MRGTARVREVLVVHDATCGACAGIARDLPRVLRVPVRLRSCRDPDLRATHPDLPHAAVACRVPAVGTVGVDGTVRWRAGLRAAPALLGLVRPRALPRALAVLTRGMAATARRTSRARRVDHGQRVSCRSAPQRSKAASRRWID
jgi:hypothetical protein